MFKHCKSSAPKYYYSTTNTLANLLATSTENIIIILDTSHDINQIAILITNILKSINLQIVRKINYYHDETVLLNTVNSTVASIIKQIVQSSPTISSSKTTSDVLVTEVTNSIISSSTAINQLLPTSDIVSAITTALTSSSNVATISAIFLTFIQLIYQARPIADTNSSLLAAINISASML